MTEIIWSTLSAVAIVTSTWFLSGWVAGVVRALLTQTRLDPMVRNHLVNVVRPVIITIGFIAGLSQIGVDIRVLLALLAAFAIALGLGMREMTANLFAGATLLTRRPFNVGDMVEVAGVSGVVQTVTMAVVVIQEVDGTQTTITNAQVMAAPIRNKSRAADRL
jgi:small conductance mechanosensitive channel